MTFPTEFNSQSKVIGNSSIKHPIYTFRVNLDLQIAESVGPNTNAHTGTVLHPDAYQTSGDLGRSNRTTRALQNISWFPMMSQSGNLEINDDGTITVYGVEGKRLLDTYTTGSNPLLTLTNSAPYTTA
jgi:hypothetical protein